jgi:endonuclease/exonuclease/phosphatase (EEP) superfamily protein YafD
VYYKSFQGYFLKIATKNAHLGDASLGGNVQETIARSFNRIVSWNINGFASKKHQVIDIVESEKVGVIMLQETLHTSSKYPLVIPGFYTFSVGREDGFRGQAVLVRKGRNAYQIPHEEKSILHVKISSWKNESGDFPLHVISCYWPSGANRKRERKEKFSKLCRLAEDIKKKDTKAQIIIGGDFNDSKVKTTSRLIETTRLLTVLESSGTNITRYPKKGRARDLDHMITWKGNEDFFSKAKVLIKYMASDHKPLRVKIKGSSNIETQQKGKWGFNRSKWSSKREDIVSHNRWNVLLTEVEAPIHEDDLNEEVNNFNFQSEMILRNLGIKTYIGSQGGKRQFPAKLRRLLKKYKRLTKRFHTDKSVECEWRRAKKDFRNAKRKWETSQDINHYKKVGDDMLSMDFKSAWQRLGTTTHLNSGDGKGMPLSDNQPLRDQKGDLQSDKKQVREIMTNHYRKLHQDDPGNISRDEEFWPSTIPDLELTAEENAETLVLVEELTWPEILEAIRAMNRDTAPGKDGLHINMFKCMVREESMEEVRAHTGGKKWEHIQVDLDAKDLPNTPRTKMGKAVWRILQAIWVHEYTPTAWQINEVISLYKGGDPELPDNYRGITLISVFQKILTGVLMKRLYGHMNSNNLFDESQAGFRPGEEAIAQFIALAEIVRRRHIVDKQTRASPTLVAFIDLKKAYDKVPIELVLAVLKKFGFPLKYIRIIRNIYRNTQIVVRAGGNTSDPYILLRGLRQGCLLSPVLFIIFVTNLLKYLRNLKGGVGTPWWNKGDDSGGTCYGLLYADDIASLQNDIMELHYFLNELENWCKLWMMEVSPKKSGIMVWSESAALIRDVKSFPFKIDGQTIPVVESYKYLGIKVEESFPFSRTSIPGSISNEDSYVQTLRLKGLKRLHQLRPTLISPNCPIAIKVLLVRTFLVPSMLYGAEWLGLRRLNSEPLQRVINMAALWIIGLKSNTTLTDAKVVCVELGFPSMEEELVAARARLYYKSSKMSNSQQPTWLARLTSTKTKGGRENSWIFGSRTELYKILKLRRKYSDDTPDMVDEDKTKETDAPLRFWAAMSQAMDRHVKANTYRSEFLTNVNDCLTGRLGEEDVELNWGDTEWDENPTDAMCGFDYAYERCIQNRAINGKKGSRTRWEAEKICLIRECVREREWSSMRSESFNQYDHFNYGITKGFIRNTIRMTHLREGIRILVSIRVRSFPDINKLWQQARFAGRHLDPSFKECCPLCGEKVDRGWNWAHYIISCKDDKICGIRECIKPWIQLATKETLNLEALPSEYIEANSVPETGITNTAVAVLMVGGAFGKTVSSYTIGFGACDVLPDNMSQFGWQPIATFLQGIYPTLKVALERRFGNSWDTNSS